MSYRNVYTEIRDRHRKEIDAIDIRCALTDKSFEEMFAAWGLPLTSEGFSQVYHIGQGCYIKKVDYPHFEEVSERHEKEMSDFLSHDENFEQAMIYEFCNHEAMYSEYAYDDALAALGIDAENMSEREKRVYKSARKKFLGLVYRKRLVLIK